MIADREFNMCGTYRINLHAQDVFLASLEELAYALSGVEQGTITDDPLGALRQLLRSDNAGVAGAAYVSGRRFQAGRSRVSL